MSTPRFQLNDPNEPSNSLKNLNFIPRFLQDPLFITIKNPTAAQQATLLDEAKAVIHPEAFHMIASALKNGTELDRNLLSHIAETGRVVIEEASSLVWNKATPEVSRYIVIRRLVPEESDMDLRDNQNSPELFSGDLFQLTLEHNGRGELEATLGWENGDCAESHQSLIRRWEMVDTVFRRLKMAPPPLDLLPCAAAHSDNRGDDEYNINGVTLVCYRINEDVILQDLSGDERGRRADQDEGAEERLRDNEPDDDDEDPFGLFTSARDGVEQEPGSVSDLHLPSSSDYTDGNEFEDGVSESYPYPGEDLTILDPTARQLTTIAQLSSMRITTDLAEHLLQMARTHAPLTSQDFEFVAPSIRDPLAFHRRVTYTLQGSFSEAHRYSIDEFTLNKPTMFSINLFRQPALTKDSGDFVKGVLHWEMFSDDADIPNWDRILKVAKERPR